jgi:chromate transport protein ChrA
MVAKKQQRFPGIVQGDLIAAIVGVLPELLFALLPLVVLTIVLLYSGKSFKDIISSPEWSFGSAVLCGQAVVRLVSGISRSEGANPQWVALAVAGLLVIALVPSLIVLAVVLHAHAVQEHLLPTWLTGLQIALFLLSVLVFLVFGGLGESLTQETEGNNVSGEN